MEPEQKSNGALVGLVVIIILLVVGGIYIWLSNKKAQEELQNTQTQLETLTEQDAAALDALDQESGTTETDVGVDVNTVN
ncbi:MAG: hypothetical protein V4699_02195 [Patescibacteria group bacterium]